QPLRGPDRWIPRPGDRAAAGAAAPDHPASGRHRRDADHRAPDHSGRARVSAAAVLHADVRRPALLMARIAVRLTPRGGADRLDGWDRDTDGRPVLKARVRAAPTEGQANAALIVLIARTLKIP